MTKEWEQPTSKTLAGFLGHKREKAAPLSPRLEEMSTRRGLDLEEECPFSQSQGFYIFPL